ncbi:MAG: S24/S26 family peptidase [Candidatus Competibacter sp.]|nr:S24/S26 family peptidase [Candidatus Competibacter sp.]MDG4582557.1 S24/S26 family peptidase [Candidatus Competibacter sp.]
MAFVSTRIVRGLRELAVESPVSLRVSGECMVPLLANGAMIQVVRQRFYWPGDLMVVHAPDGRLLVHRLLGCYSKGRGWRWLTQADNARWPDAALPTERIIGKVCGGDCSEWLVRVPLAHRVKAVLRFFRFVLIHMRILCR